MFVPAPSYQDPCKACGKEKALVQKWATSLLIECVSQYLSKRLLITLLLLEHPDPLKLPQSRFICVLITFSSSEKETYSLMILAQLEDFQEVWWIISALISSVFDANRRQKGLSSQRYLISAEHTPLMCPSHRQCSETWLPSVHIALGTWGGGAFDQKCSQSRIFKIFNSHWNPNSTH